MLPISSRARIVTPFPDALFTAVSAGCVTGLVVRDTALYWSGFGQAVILTLIQIGGLGVITIAVSFALLSGKKISLSQRSVMQSSISAPQVGGIVRLTGFILRITAAAELCGALCLMPAFCREFGPKGIWMSVFHSISAFCNAGFDLMGTQGAAFSSLTRYAHSPWPQIVLMLLIIMGGLGFLTWEDVSLHRLHLRRYRMQSKVILTMTGLLILLPTVYFLVFEFRGESWGYRILNSLFQSVTTRTAGFNTVDLTALRQPGQTMMIVLMLIGAAPGSTAGGMKTTTAAVMLANMWATFRRRDNASFFGRRIDEKAVKDASTVLMLYVTLFAAGGVLISLLEHLPVHLCLFETASAIATVGLTLGITTRIGIASKCILMLLMFTGRVGGLTVVYAAMPDTPKVVSKLPQEKISVG
jgi:trk system potassium uptake protein TrkH